jgi:thymidylate kinase
MASLLARLGNDLDAHSVPYCCFKSSAFVSEASAGLRDIDLFVERRALGKAIGVLQDLGFKCALPSPNEIVLGQHHYYGFDPDLDHPLHVHLFNQIVTGESFVKSHVFPFDSVLLANTYEIDGIRVASRPAEMILYVSRIFVKYGSFLDLVYGMRRSVHVHEEMAWLRDESAIGEAVRGLTQCCPVFDQQLFAECIASLSREESVFKRIRLAWKVRRRLRVYARHSPLGRTVAYARRYWGEAMRRLKLRPRGKAMQAGGAVIAIVGPDAVGKTTVVSDCARWLGKDFSVRTVHAGRPKGSLLTAPVNILLWMGRRVMSRGSSWGQGGPGPSEGEARPRPVAGTLVALLYAIRAVGLAWDRRRTLIRARRLAANGLIVFSDRYPSDIAGAQDSRRLEQQSGKGGVAMAMYNYLARLEEKLYRQVPPPDIAVRLTVSAEVAKRRNKMRRKANREDDAALEARHRQDSGWHRSGTKYVCDLNTEGALPDTLSRVRALIWERL